MRVPKGAIDCDLHPAMPPASALVRYLPDYWRDQLANRHIDRMGFNLTSYPPNAPLSARPDWRGPTGAPGGDLDLLRREALDRFGTRLAICNPLHGAIALFNADMAAALCAAVNDWVARELLVREPRLRASILVPTHDPQAAVGEIERVGADRRFVQVMLLAMGEAMLGRRLYWPIYAAAERLQLPIGIHAGSTYQHAPTPAGQPDLLARTLDQLGSDEMLLFSTDFPHWHFDGDDVLPDGLPDDRVRKLTIDNPLATYPRLRDGAAMSDNATKREETVR